MTQTVTSAFRAYHNVLAVQEINTAHYTCGDIIYNLHEYLLDPGDIVKGVAGVGKWPYVGFVTKFGIGILIIVNNASDVWFIADPQLNDNLNVQAIINQNSSITSADQLAKLIALLSNMPA